MIPQELQEADTTGDLNYEDMVFAAEDEVLPSLQAAKAAVLGEDDNAAGKKVRYGFGVLKCGDVDIFCICTVTGQREQFMGPKIARKGKV